MTLNTKALSLQLHVYSSWLLFCESLSLLSEAYMSSCKITFSDPAGAFSSSQSLDSDGWGPWFYGSCTSSYALLLIIIKYMVVNLTTVFSALVRPRLVLSSCSLQLLIADSERSSSGSLSDAEYSSRSVSFSQSFLSSPRAVAVFPTGLSC